MRSIILKFVLENAFKYGGSVNPKAVLGQVLRANPELKKDVPKVLAEITKTASDVSGWTEDEIKSKLELEAPELLEVKEKKEEGPLKRLANAEKGKFKVRIAPSPSGPLHIGHAYGALINAGYAKMYEGSLLLRIEDTNPENIYMPAYDLIPKDVKWLVGDVLKETIVQSSRLETYYDHAKELIKIGKAYVCTCDNDTWREMKAQGNACACRDLSVSEQEERYAKMFDNANGYVEGAAVLRLKTDIKHKNPAMRDFALARIVEHIHPKTGDKQRVWPLMVFSVAIDDHELGITHVLNGKDHTDNGKKEALIMEYLGWKAPEYKHWGKINFEGFKLSTSGTKKAIAQGEYEGWGDIRLATIRALRRRGYQARAFEKFALEVGLSNNDKTVSWEEFWKMINAFNRELVEKEANRYFFVADPVSIKISQAPSEKVDLDLHPDFPGRGKREINAGEDFLVSKEDAGKLELGKVHRLIDHINFTVENGEMKYHSHGYEKFNEAQNKGKIIHWLSANDENVESELLLEDHSIVKGLVEPALSCVSKGKIVQLQRMSFARLDSKEGKVVFYYLHK